MKQITSYFRNAIAASTNGTIDYKKEKFYTISANELKSGQLGAASMEFLKKSDQFHERDKPGGVVSVKAKHGIIALKTVSTEFMTAKTTETDMEELTSVLFLPVNVSRQGKLYPAEDGKMPWMPREYLEPMEEPVLAIGATAKYDAFFEETTDERNRMNSWDSYLRYAQHLYEFVTEASFEQQYVMCGQESIKTDGKYYLFEDNTVNSTFHVLHLYNHLLRNQENKLYSKLTNGELEPSRPLHKNSDLTKMKKHAGQMNGEYPLSPSQREAVNHFDEIKAGDVLAVNGPPGTGKTTLLQSIVADMYVKAALLEKNAPIIVAASTNNQAVTNIIDSFGKINPVRSDNLEKRWISGVDSFAIYYPATSKVAEAKQKRYQYTNVTGDAFTENIESEENRKKSKKLFASEYSSYSGSADQGLIVSKNDLHQKLVQLDETRVKCIFEIEKVASILKGASYEDYINKLDRHIAICEDKKREIKKALEQVKAKNRQYLERCNEWRNSYDSLPWYVRMFKKFSFFQRKILSWSYAFVDDSELTFLRRDMSIEEIEDLYLRKVDENDRQLKRLDRERKVTGTESKQYEDKRKQIDTSMRRLKKRAIELSKSTYNSIDSDCFVKKFDVSKLNDQLDQVRYVEFWLAVHYYECRWLIEENPISDKQKRTTFEGVLNKRYKRLAMLAPCMVMTFFMLPKQFLAYDGNEKKHFYMYDYIDLLIVDEAGQISPEIAIPSFSLAKKAIVVGDEQQIPPVWGTTRALDIAMAVESGVVQDKEEYTSIEENGLNCSQSSLMKIASQSCAFDKYGKGLFLSEHRRCYNEIVSFCNELVYNGYLQPMRGEAAKDPRNVLKGHLPAMGHKEIKVEHSEKQGTSRQNRKEAQQIVQWLKDNYSDICKQYEIQAIEKQEKFDIKQILGIITPFKSQSNLIKWFIKRNLSQWKNDIEVGTVHTFQGAEKRIIIFSSVYGNKDGCYFINLNNSLMNVAVSRAKDSFLVFGDRDCLVGHAKSAAGLLEKLTRNEI